MDARRMRVVVMTPHVPSRAAMLAELRADLEAQTYPIAGWVVAADYEGAGATDTANRALVGALAYDPTHILAFSDDNLMDDGHVGLLADQAKSTGADVVYSPPRVTGRDDGFEDYVNGPFDAARLARESYIDASALYRADLLKQLGGWSDARGWSDWDLHKRAVSIGARYERVPVKTWTYRFHENNVSWTRPPAA